MYPCILHAAIAHQKITFEKSNYRNTSPPAFFGNLRCQALVYVFAFWSFCLWIFSNISTFSFNQTFREANFCSSWFRPYYVYGCRANECRLFANFSKIFFGRKMDSWSGVALEYDQYSCCWIGKCLLRRLDWYRSLVLSDDFFNRTLYLSHWSLSDRYFRPFKRGTFKKTI